MLVKISDHEWLNTDNVLLVTEIRQKDCPLNLVIHGIDGSARNYLSNTKATEGIHRWLRLQQRMSADADASDAVKEIDGYLFDDVLGSWTGAHQYDLSLAKYMRGRLEMALILCNQWIAEEEATR